MFNKYGGESGGARGINYLNELITKDKNFTANIIIVFLCYKRNQE